jgi:hypothetical protein
MSETSGENGRSFDTNEDRYPSFFEVLRRVMDETDLPDGPVERLEVTCLASGEATYRVWAAREIEPQGGYLQPPE